MNDPLRTPTDAMPKGIRKGWILIVIAAVVSYGLYHILPYDENANKGLALLTFIAILWLTEAIHITITALLIPILAVVLAMPMAKGDELEPITTQAALTTFADPTIFLFWWFCPGLGVAYPETGQENCHVDYLAFRWTSRCVSTGYLLVTAALSMWISNTATAAMMLPLALGLLSHLDVEKIVKPLCLFCLGLPIRPVLVAWAPSLVLHQMRLQPKPSVMTLLTG